VDNGDLGNSTCLLSHVKKPKPALCLVNSGEFFWSRIKAPKNDTGKIAKPKKPDH
jgi:hypothetical protein